MEQVGVPDPGPWAGVLHDLMLSVGPVGVVVIVLAGWWIWNNKRAGKRAIKEEQSHQHGYRSNASIIAALERVVTHSKNTSDQLQQLHLVMVEIAGMMKQSLSRQDDMADAVGRIDRGIVKLTVIGSAGANGD